MLTALALLCATPTLAADADLLPEIASGGAAAVGVHRFAVVLMPAGYNFGQMRLEIRQGKGKSSYTSEFTLDMRMPQQSQSGVERVELDKSMSALSGASEMRELAADGTETKKQSRTFSRKGGNWQLREDTNGVVRSASLASAAPNHASKTSWLAAGLSVAGHSPGTWTLSGISWPDDAEAPSVDEIRFEIRPAAPWAHRGTEVQVTPFVITDGDETTHLMVDGAGHVLAMYPASDEVRMIACSSDAQCAADVALEPADVVAVRDVVARFMRVMAHAEPVDALDEVVYWPEMAVRTGVAATVDDTAPATALAAETKRLMAAGDAPIAPELIPLVRATLAVEVNGDAATVRAPSGSMALARVDGRWWLVSTQ